MNKRNVEKRRKRLLQKERNLNRWIHKVRQEVDSVHLSEDEERYARILATHGRLCSCELCGNPRRHFKEITIQEKKAAERADVEYLLSDLYEER